MRRLRRGCLPRRRSRLPLGTLAADTPKLILPVGGRPFLDYLLDEASRHGIARCLLLCGHRAERIRKAYEGRIVRGMRVETVAEDEPAGTGGALAPAVSKMDEMFFLVNGNSSFDCNWLALWTPAHTAAWLSGDTVCAFKPARESTLPVNAGIYLMHKSVLGVIGPGFVSLEKDVLPRLAAQGACGAT